MDPNTEGFYKKDTIEIKKSKNVDTVRFIDIDSEILGGKGVKPGLVLTEEDPVIDLTEETLHTAAVQKFRPIPNIS